MNKIFPIKFIFCFLVYFFSLSCNNQEHTEDITNQDPLAFVPPVFPEEILAKPTFLKLDSYYSLPSEIEIIDSILVAKSWDGIYSFQLINKNSCKYINSTISDGDGQGDISPYGLYISSKTDKNIDLFSQQYGMYYRFDKEDFSSNKPPLYMVSFKNPGMDICIPVNDMFVSTNNPHFLKAKRFTLFNQQGQEINSFDIYPEIKGVTDTSHLRGMLLGNRDITARPNSNEFAISRLYGAILEVFTVKRDSILKKVEGRYYMPKIIKKDNPGISYSDRANCVHGFIKIKSTDNYIYALFCGQTLKERMKKGDKLGQYIWVFDWDLNPVRSYKIKGGKLTTLAIDEDNNRAYFTRVDTKEKREFGYINLKE